MTGVERMIDVRLLTYAIAQILTS